MADRVIRTVLAGDSSSLEKAMDKAGAGAKGMASDMDRAAGQAKSFGSSIDNAADKSDKSERTFMGTADVLDGLGAAFGLPIGRAVELGRAAGDMSGGFTMLAPAIKGIGTALNGVATGPMGIWITVGALIIGALIALWKNCEAFRDIVTAAFDAVMKVIGPVGDFIGSVVKGLGPLFGGAGDDAKAMAEANEKALDEMKAAYEEDLGKVTAVLDGMADPLERFNHANETTLQQAIANLRFNVSEYEKWAADIKVIRDRFGEDTAQFVIDQGPEWHGLADQIANGTDAMGADFTGLIGTLDRLEREAGQTASAVHREMAGMADQLRIDVGEANDVLGGMFFPLGFEPTYAPGANRSPVKRHSGGMVPGPIGREVPIMAQGGERVIPLGASGGGGGTLIINLATLDPAGAGPAVMRAIEEYESRNGTRFARAAAA